MEARSDVTVRQLGFRHLVAILFVTCWLVSCALPAGATRRFSVPESPSRATKPLAYLVAGSISFRDLSVLAQRLKLRPPRPIAHIVKSPAFRHERRTVSSHRIVVVLDPGHGGPDTGAVHYLPDGRIDLMERTVTLEIALRAAIALRHHGYIVYLTRTSDRAVNVPPRDYNHDGTIDQVDELEARVAFANNHHADLFVSIHINGSPAPDIHGLTVYYCPAHPFAGANLRLARLLDIAIDQHLQRVGSAPFNWGVPSDVSLQVPQHYADYPWFLVLGPAAPQHGLIAQQAVAALGETLYLTNDREAALLHQPRILDAIAAGYVQGIERYVATTTRH